MVSYLWKLFNSFVSANPLLLATKKGNSCNHFVALGWITSAEGGGNGWLLFSGMQYSFLPWQNFTFLTVAFCSLLFWILCAVVVYIYSSLWSFQIINIFIKESYCIISAESNLQTRKILVFGSTWSQKFTSKWKQRRALNCRNFLEEVGGLNKK